MSVIKVSLYTHPSCPFSQYLLNSPDFKRWEREIQQHPIISVTRVSDSLALRGPRQIPFFLVSQIPMRGSNLAAVSQRLALKTRNQYAATLQVLGVGLLLPELWNLTAEYMAFCL